MLDRLGMDRWCMGVDPCVDRGTCPLLFEVEGTPCVLSPYFFGGRHFCTNAHGIHWMTGAIIVEFSHVTSHENYYNCCHRMSDFKDKMHKI